MSEHDVPDDSSLKGYTDITPDDSGADIVVKVFGASDKNMHNIPQKIKDGMKHTMTGIMMVMKKVKLKAKRSMLKYSKS